MMDRTWPYQTHKSPSAFHPVDFCGYLWRFISFRFSDKMLSSLRRYLGPPNPVMPITLWCRPLLHTRKCCASLLLYWFSVSLETGSFLAVKVSKVENWLVTSFQTCKLCSSLLREKTVASLWYSANPGLLGPVLVFMKSQVSNHSWHHSTFSSQNSLFPHRHLVSVWCPYLLLMQDNLTPERTAQRGYCHKWSPGSTDHFWEDVKEVHQEATFPS